MTSKWHPHNDLLGLIGLEVVKSQFSLTPQRLYAWRVRGVPYGYRGAVAQLASVHHQPLPSDFFAPPRKAAA